MTREKRYRLEYLPLFWDDLNGAVVYISRTLNNPAAAERLLDEAEAVIFRHLENPTYGVTYKERSEEKETYYWFPVGNYMVFYVVKDDVMEVCRFLYGARDITRMRL